MRVYLPRGFFVQGPSFEAPKLELPDIITDLCQYPT